MPTNPLADWFTTPLGAYLLQKERAYLDDVTPDIFGFHALQLGLPQFDLLRENRMTHRMKIDVGGGVDVCARSHELPIATQSIDLALLPHALEFAREPHAVLREIDRVMMPEGRIIILGFNPWSLWGLRSAIGPSRHETPWNGKFVSLLRVKDWLALLGFEVSAGRLICYVPPVKGEKWLKRLAFMEPAGDRWWAVGGAVYMLQAIKRVRGVRLLTPAWHEAQAREKRVALAAKREGRYGHIEGRVAAHRQVTAPHAKTAAKAVEIHTDGACKGNPGPGGWGALLTFDGKERELFGGEALTTNNRMELTAVIEALSALKRPSRVILHTDSQYVQKGITEWIHGWKAKGWKTASKAPVKNVDLWMKLDELAAQHHIAWRWVKGHAGHDGNERADALANRGVPS